MDVKHNRTVYWNKQTLMDIILLTHKKIQGKSIKFVEVQTHTHSLFSLIECQFFLNVNVKLWQ
jgi:hypothetical protein